MIRRIFLGLCVFIAAGLHPPVMAQNAKIDVAEPWARATIGQSRNTAAYMKLTNRGPEADRLVAASTPMAGKVELHTTVRDGDVLRMREVKGVDLKPGQTVSFAPGGLHVMLVDAKPLKAGATFPLTLEFEKAGKQEVTVAVRQGPPQAGQHQH